MGRGRPKGSKNKVKTIGKLSNATSLPIKELKRQIRHLRKLKRDTQKKSDARRQINKQIRDLKAQLNTTFPTIKMSSKRENLINEIYKYNPLLQQLGMDMNKYTDEQLELHLKRIRRN